VEADAGASDNLTPAFVIDFRSLFYYGTGLREHFVQAFLIQGVQPDGVGSAR
jgi:hypothetical protein